MQSPPTFGKTDDMFSASPFAPARGVRQLYREVAVHSSSGSQSDAHHLVTLLFDGLFEAISQGRGAIRSGDIASKAKALSRAAAIVEEGLRAALDLRQGGPLARDLHDLYTYVSMRLTRANLNNDDAALQECVDLMQPLAEAWASIRPQSLSTGTEG
jgi:flagellar protein FliS